MRLPTSAQVEWSDGPLLLRVSSAVDTRDFRRVGAFGALAISQAMDVTAIAVVKSMQAHSIPIRRRAEQYSRIVSRAIVAAG